MAHRAENGFTFPHDAPANLNPAARVSFLSGILD